MRILYIGGCSVFEFVFRWCNMVYNILIFASVTHALKAQGKLENAKIRSKIEKLRKEQSLNGCGYGLKIANEDILKAKKILDNDGIMIKEILDYK